MEFNFSYCWARRVSARLISWDAEFAFSQVWPEGYTQTWRWGRLESKGVMQGRKTRGEGRVKDEEEGSRRWKRGQEEIDEVTEMEGGRKICYRHIPEDCGHSGDSCSVCLLDRVCVTGPVQFREGSADKTWTNCTHVCQGWTAGQRRVHLWPFNSSPDIRQDEERRRGSKRKRDKCGGGEAREAVKEGERGVNLKMTGGEGEAREEKERSVQIRDERRKKKKKKKN